MPDDIGSHPQPAAAVATAPPPANGARRKRLFMILGGVVLAGAVIWGLYYVLVGSRHVATDNAYVNADTAQVTALVAGPIVQAPVGETTVVMAGQVIAVIDPADFELAVDRARAELGQAQRRVGQYFANDEALAAQPAARAKLAQAELDLARTTIRSPVDGVVARKSVVVGQKVANGAPVMSIVPIQTAYVDANFKEVQLRKVRPGQPVALTSDLYGKGVTFHGKVAGVGGGTGSAFALIPAQNATGNWIKVVQRVPVRIALDPKELAEHPLRVGLSMEAVIDISK